VVSSVFRCNALEKGIRVLEKHMNLRGIRSYHFKTDHFDLRYWKGGNGPVILFLHGFGVDALLTWRKEMLHFSKTHTVIAPDLLWFGKSSSNLKPELSAQREALLALLASLEIPSVTLVGQSYGGFVALDLAASGIVKTEKLVVANCPGTTFNTSTLRNVCMQFKVDKIEELFVFKSPEGLQRLMNLSAYKDVRVPANVLKQFYRLYYSDHHEQLRELLRSLPEEQKRYPDPSVFHGMNMLVLWGEHDELFPLDEGIRFAADTAAEMTILKGCGHMSQLDNPKAFCGRLNSFIFR
jgi:pimeloyl-ACP methyl ester carboxylesterase